MAPSDAPAAALRDEHLTWTIFQTSAGRWWAIRKNPLQAHLAQGACVASLDAPDLEALTRLLDQQHACHQQEVTV
ncbi:hypothetical protein [Sphaerisporangium aureirubrum]|uniref:Uncharacterized protein n=1 Tax=Sphaerisporangium aureirubrum TaxID=1544736 RepID=A0ABW1NTP7_9ACTN